MLSVSRLGAGGGGDSKARFKSFVIARPASQHFSLCMFEIGEMFICNDFMYMLEGEMHWENDLSTLSREKKRGLGATLLGKFCCPHHSDNWKT